MCYGGFRQEVRPDWVTPVISAQPSSPCHHALLNVLLVTFRSVVSTNAMLNASDGHQEY